MRRVVLAGSLTFQRLLATARNDLSRRLLRGTRRRTPTASAARLCSEWWPNTKLIASSMANVSTPSIRLGQSAAKA